MKLIIPMAGRGTRVRPHSHVTPKPLLPVCGKSMVERIIETFSAVLPRPIDEGVFVLGPDFGDSVRSTLTDICARHGMSASFVVQSVARGTAHAVGCAGEYLHGEGIVVFADTLFIMEPGVDLGEADVVAWVKHVDDPSRFGVAVRDGDRIVELVEKPQKLVSTEALIGIYYVKELGSLGSAITYLFDNGITGVGDEYQLTDAFDRMLKADMIFRTATVSAWLDCGTIESLLTTTMEFLDLSDFPKSSASVSGSTIIEPVFFGEGVVVENSTVGPHVSIEAGGIVRGSTVERSIIFSGAMVENAILENSLIGRSARVTGCRGRFNIGDHSEAACAR
jgi:glucose-1-phosphate thymidylyltransferase